MLDTNTLTNYEVTRVGYDPSTDKTDHLIQWISAPSEALVRRFAESQGWQVERIDLLDNPCVEGESTGIDAILDDDGRNMMTKSKDVTFEELMEMPLKTPVDCGTLPKGHPQYDPDDPAMNDIPGPHNAERAEWALAAVTVFAETTFHSRPIDEDAETVISDFLCDLMHLCRVNNVDFDTILDRARRGHDAEKFDGGWA